MSGWSGGGVLWVQTESGMAGREERSPMVTAHAVALVGEAGCTRVVVEWGLEGAWGKKAPLLALSK